MFKLVVLSALVALAVAKPSLYEVAPVIAKTYVAPAAVSSTYREDIIHKPAAVAYAAPLVHEPVHVAEHVAVAAPVVAKTVVAPAAVSHTYREDVISKPAAVAYSAPAVYAAAAPVAYAAAPVAYAAAPVAHAVPAAVSHSYRSDIVSSPYLANTIVAPAHYAYAAHAPAVHAW